MLAADDGHTAGVGSSATVRLARHMQPEPQSGGHCHLRVPCAWFHGSSFCRCVAPKTVLSIRRDSDVYLAAFAGTIAAAGSYEALAEKVPHLVRMGFNALELMPIHEFNECELYAPHVPVTGGARVNFWGYSTIGFNAPMARYAASPPGAGTAEAVKALVRTCHAAGVEVILDVVFNHTAEGNELGPTVSLRGLDNAVYYITAPEGQFYNYSGCGNTVNCNHPVVRRFILDCLRYWAIEYRIDGFRFDLASILTRASSTWETTHMWGGHGGMTDPPDAQVVRGTPLGEPPLVDLLSNDGVLRVRALCLACVMFCMILTHLCMSTRARHLNARL